MSNVLIMVEAADGGVKKSSFQRSPSVSSLRLSVAVASTSSSSVRTSAVRPML